MVGAVRTLVVETGNMFAITLEAFRMPVQQVSNVLTRWALVLTDLDDRADLSEGEPRCLGCAQEAEPGERDLVVVAVTRCGPSRRE